MSGSGGGIPDFGRPSRPERDDNGIRGEDSGGGAGGGGETNACASLDFVTFLQSPKRGVVEKLSEGDRLTLVPTNGGPPLQVMTNGGDIAGSIVSNVSLILGCIGKGYVYVADVVNIQSGAVELRVHA
ncbi:hypothetical protein ANRL2_02157 [Anaerolineae bacterium]|nr:hypothetical protein ANRL2_02157 [Anaerolineae bacterium]